MSSRFEDERERDRDGQESQDDGQRGDRADVEQVGGEHFERREGENCGKAVVEEAEFGKQVGK